MTFAELIHKASHTSASVAEASGVDQEEIEAIIRGRIPDAKTAVTLSLALRCPLTMFYEVILNTPDQMEHQDTGT